VTYSVAFSPLASADLEHEGDWLGMAGICQVVSASEVRIERVMYGLLDPRPADFQ